MHLIKNFYQHFAFLYKIFLAFQHLKNFLVLKYNQTAFENQIVNPYFSPRILILNIYFLNIPNKLSITLSSLSTLFLSIFSPHFLHTGLIATKSLGLKASLLGATTLLKPHFGHTSLYGFGFIAIILAPFIITK